MSQAVQLVGPHRLIGSQARQDELIIASKPDEQYPSGILSIQIHQITGLELEVLNKNKAQKNEGASDEEEEGVS